MKVLVKFQARGAFQELELKKGLTCADLISVGGLEEGPQVVAAKVNNQAVELGTELKDGDIVSFIDITSQHGSLIYQHSLSLVYLKAVEDILGDCKVIIENALNHGLYTTIKGAGVLDESVIKSISNRMKDLIEEDAPIIKYQLKRDDAMRVLEGDGMKEKIKLFNGLPEEYQVTFYSLKGCRNFFYDLMVPSTGYVSRFELRAYGKGIILTYPQTFSPKTLPPVVEQKKLYDAFSEQLIWDRILGISYVADLNEQIRRGQWHQLIQVSEALHEKKVAEIADEIKKKKKRIILIAGPSSSGKTTFAHRLMVQLRVNGMRPLYLGTDDYFFEREETPLNEYGEKDFESINAIDIVLFNRHMNELLSGKEVDLPKFDFLSGKKLFGHRKLTLEEGQPIVIEGIHGLNEELTPYISSQEKFKIYISPLTQLNMDSHNRISTTDERLLRRLVRDNLYRGYDAQSTIKSWPMVRAGEDSNIFPYSEEADVLFNSYHVYEIAVLKKYAEPLLEEVCSDMEEYSEAQRLLNFLRYFDSIKEDQEIVNNSIIREFIGGSIYN